MRYLNDAVIYLFIVIWLLGIAGSVHAREVRVGLLHGNEDVFAYELSVIQLALDYAPSDHEMILVPLPDTTQDRVFSLLEQGIGSFNIFFSGYSRDREERFLQVDIPLTRGLLGHRIFIIREEQEEKYKNVNSLSGLKDIMTVGSGIGWPDSAIFQSNKFAVVTAKYESLWTMLAKGRFDGFNRGIHEAYVEIKQRKGQYPNLVVEDNIMVVYPFDYFIYLNKNDTDLQQIIYSGLQTAYETGAFLKNFNNHPTIQKVLIDANPASRQRFDIPNPQISDRIKAISKEYWHRF